MQDGASGQRVHERRQLDARVAEHGNPRRALTQEDFLDRIEFAQDRFLQRAGKFAEQGGEFFVGGKQGGAAHGGARFNLPYVRPRRATPRPRAGARPRRDDR